MEKMKTVRKISLLKKKSALLFLSMFLICIKTYSQIKETVVETVAGAIIGMGIEEYQKNKLVKLAFGRDGAIIAIIPATTKRLGFYQDGNIVITKSNVYFGASEFSLTETLILPIVGLSHKNSKYEGLFGYYTRDAMEVTSNGETRKFVFFEEAGEWEKFRNGIDKAIAMRRAPIRRWSLY